MLQELRDSGYADKLAFGIVLTGGSANLKDIDELFRRVTKMEVRIGVPDTGIDEASREKVADPVYAPAIGILLKGAELGSLRRRRASGDRRTGGGGAARTPGGGARRLSPGGAGGADARIPPCAAAQPAAVAVRAAVATRVVRAACAAACRGADAGAGMPRRSRPCATRRRHWPNRASAPRLGSIFQKTFDKINL